MIKKMNVAIRQVPFALDPDDTSALVTPLPFHHPHYSVFLLLFAGLVTRIKSRQFISLVSMSQLFHAYLSQIAICGAGKYKTTCKIVSTLCRKNKKYTVRDTYWLRDMQRVEGNCHTCEEAGILKSTPPVVAKKTKQKKSLFSTFHYKQKIQ